MILQVKYNTQSFNNIMYKNNNMYNMINCITIIIII